MVIVWVFWLVRKAGLIVNDGKELAVQTAISVEKKLEKSNYQVVRVSSSGGMVGFAMQQGKQHLLKFQSLQ